MAIRWMVNEDRKDFPGVEFVGNYPGAEAGRIEHCEACPHHAAGRTEKRPEGLYGDCVHERGTVEGRPYDKCYGPTKGLWMETCYEGVVLRVWERNGYDDSDFYATVWDDLEGRPRDVEYASTRGWSYPNGANVDATPEVLAKYEAWLEAKRVAARKAREEDELKTPRPGKTLRVVKGRKVPVGTVGECVWYGEGRRYGFDYAAKYGARSTTPMRVGLKKADGEVVWTDAKNVEVVLEEKVA